MKKYRTIKHFEFDPVNNTITVVFRYQDVQYIDGIPQVSPPGSSGRIPGCCAFQDRPNILPSPRSGTAAGRCRLPTRSSGRAL